MLHLGLEYHPKQNPQAKRMTRWVPYTSIVPRRPARSRWTHWSGNAPVELFETFPPSYDDVDGVFGALDVLHKTRHPGQPAWGVWDIATPNFDVEFFELKVDSWLKQWRQSREGREFVEAKLKRRFREGSERDERVRDRMVKGVELLEEERREK